MTDPTTAAAVDPNAAYDQKSLRLKAMAARIHEIIAAAEPLEPDSPEASALMVEKLDIDAAIAELLAQPCAAGRSTPNGGQVSCTRSTGHPDDHFDETFGIGWANENEDASELGRDATFDSLLNELCDSIAVSKAGEALNLSRAIVDRFYQQREQMLRTHAILDRVGVPRDRLENTLTLVHRTNLFIDRLSKRLHTQVENNMVLYNAIRDALTSLVGSPNSGQLRVKTAIERLRGVLPSKKSPGGIHLQ